MFWHTGIVDVVYFVGRTRSTEQYSTSFVARTLKVEARYFLIDDEDVTRDNPSQDSSPLTL